LETFGMKRFLTSVATVGVTIVAAGGLFVGFAGNASAAGPPPWEPDGNSVGDLLFFDAAGNEVIGGNLTDAPIAAYVEGATTVRSGDTKAQLRGFLPVNNGLGPASWTGEPLGASTAYPNASAPAPLNSSTLPLYSGTSGDSSVANLVSDLPNNATDAYAGLYQLRLYTSATGQANNTKYDSADIQINTSAGTWSVVYPAPALTATTTTLTASPSSPQLAGTSVTLTATINPSAGGTVQFKSGATAIGSPVAVSGGTAQVTTTTLAVGADSLSAVFTPSASSAFSGSTGTLTYTITAPPATGTTTGLSINPGTAPAFTAVNLTANVSKTSDSSALASGTGTVKFFEGGTTLLGSGAVGAGGVATFSDTTFNVGTHHITAQFVPADPTVYASSTSLDVDFTATAPTSTPDSQTVDVTIPAGSLTITSPYTPTSPFNLGTAVPDPGGAKFTAQGAFGTPATPVTGNDGGVTVTDSRAGNQPWTASATVTDFTDAGPDVINGQNLTFTNVKPEYYPGNALQAGSVVTNDIPNTAIYAAGASGSDGLKGGPHSFAKANNGAGTVNIDGELTLTAPSSTPAGSYTATLTFTIA
jgi:hypothetical protein